jgi:hypothetical protein
MLAPERALSQKFMRYQTTQDFTTAWRRSPTTSYDCELPPDARAEVVPPRRPTSLKRTGNWPASSPRSVNEYEEPWPDMSRYAAASQFLVALGLQNLSVTIPLGLPIMWPKVERNCAQTRMREQNDGRVTR